MHGSQADASTNVSPEEESVEEDQEEEEANEEEEEWEETNEEEERQEGNEEEEEGEDWEDELNDWPREVGHPQWWDGCVEGVCEDEHGEAYVWREDDCRGVEGEEKADDWENQDRPKDALEDM